VKRRLTIRAIKALRSWRFGLYGPQFARLAEGRSLGSSALRHLF
jgi:hypothetical protein